MDLSRLRPDQRKSILLTVDGAEGEAEERFSFSHRVLTPALIADVDAIQAETNVDRLCRQLTMLLAGWDLTEGDAPVPITEEAIRALPMAMLFAIRDAIFEPAAPKSTT